MFFFIAAKHASHAVPVKDLTRLLLLQQKEGTPGKNAVPPSVRESQKYRQLASHGEGRAVQFSGRRTTHSHQGFTVTQRCACLDQHTQK